MNPIEDVRVQAAPAGQEQAVAPPSSPDAGEERWQRRRANGAASREQTRRRLLAAADELFRSQGYTATTVSQVAAHAGVSVQTLYLVWGSKQALLRAASEATAAAASTPDLAQWRATVRAELADEAGEDPDAAAYLAAAASLFVRVASRSAVYRRIHEAALGADPAIAADVAATMAERRATMAAVAREVPARGLREDLDADQVADTLWALASPQVYDLLTLQAGYSDERYQGWLTRTLTAALCQA